MNKANRAHLHDLMTFLLDREPQVNYPLHDIRGPKDAETWKLSEAQMRARLERGGHIMSDCSQMATELFKWAGLADPNGLGYAVSRGGIPLCFTGTLLQYLRHYTDPKGAGVGALVVYGPSTGDHVSVVYEVGRDPLLFSHGFDGGPVLIRLSAQRKMHRPPVTLLNVSRIGLAQA